MWKRAAPEMLSRSRMARAGKSSAAARATSSSGADEPSRKLNALWARSSTYSLVITAFDEPVLRWLAVYAIESTIAERDVPLVAIPCGGCPPVTGSSPGSGCVENFSLDASSGEAHGAVAFERNGGGKGRTEKAEGLTAGDWGLGVGDWRSRHEIERLVVMRVPELGNANVAFADNAADAGER